MAAPTSPEGAQQLAAAPQQHAAAGGCESQVRRRHCHAANEAVSSQLAPPGAGIHIIQPHLLWTGHCLTTG